MFAKRQSVHLSIQLGWTGDQQVEYIYTKEIFQEITINIVLALTLT